MNKSTTTIIHSNINNRGYNNDIDKNYNIINDKDNSKRAFILQISRE